MESDEVNRRKKLAFLREHYIPIVDYSLEEQSQKGMLEASKKLKLLKRILLNDNELPDMNFLHKSEAILKKLDSRQKAKPEDKPKTTITVAATSTSSVADDECQVIEVKKVEQKRISTECPRSPSPDNSEPSPCTEPTLIPIEKQKSLLDLPMPACDDDDEPLYIHQSSFLRQQPPPFQHRPPPHQSNLPNPIARLIEGVHNSNLNQPLQPPPMPPFFCSSDTDLRFPSSDDIDMRETREVVETFEPSHFEEVPSPPRTELDLNSDDDDDDLVIDETHNTSPKETEKQKQLPPPTEPLKPPPKPPSLINLVQTELESLAQTAPSAGREKPQELELKGPADDFIPSRQISRVPSSLMASKTGTITMPSPRPSASPRARPSSVRIPPSPAYEPHDLFTPDAIIPKYQFNAQPQRPVQVCTPVYRHQEPTTRIPQEMQQAPPVTLPDFLPPPSVSFPPPQRPNQISPNRDPRAANQDFRDPRRMAHERQMFEPQHRPGQYGPPPPQHVNNDPRLHGRSHGSRPVAIVPSVDRQGQYVASSYKEHKRLKELEKKKEADQRRKKNQELSLIEKKNKEQEEKRRREAEERSQKNSEDKASNDRLQKMTDIVKMKVQSKPTSKVQCIDPLPLPLSEMKRNRRASDDRRSSTDSDSSSTYKEKNADKSLEKVSPLGTLYGEMPQPAKTSVFRIPKKPKPKQPSPTKSQRSPTPPRSKKSSPSQSISSSSDEADETPALRYDSSEDETDVSEKSVLTATPSANSSIKDSESGPISQEALAEAIRSTLKSMGINPSESKAADGTVIKKPEEQPAGSDITSMIRTLVQQEIQKIHHNKNEPEVSSSSAVEMEDSSQPPVSTEPESTDDLCAPDQSNVASPKQKVDQMFTDSEGSEDDSKAASAQNELRNHLKKAVRIAVRKNELDKLQEDLRESFISDAVMGAVGPRARNPIDRFSAEAAPRRSRRILEDKPVEEKAEGQEVNLIDVTRQPVVKLMRLPVEKKPQTAKRGGGRLNGSMSRPSSVNTTPVPLTAASEASDNEQPSSIASDDTMASELSLDVPVRGVVSGRGSTRGRGRGGRRGTRSNRPPEHYPEREAVIDVSSLAYVWKDGKIMPCKLCMYEGKKLVDHYVTKHPDIEVLISRLDQKEALHAILQSKKADTQILQCRFCHGNFSHAAEFLDHVAEHTGEYRYSCTLCDYKKPRNSTVVQHLKSAHSNNQPPAFIGKSIDLDSHYLPGFLCGFCNFVQMDKETVLKHVDKRHRHEAGAVCTPGLEEVNEINLVKMVEAEEEVDRPLPVTLSSIKVETANLVLAVTEESQARDDLSFLSMLDNLIQDKPQNQQTGKSFLESIRKSKTNESDETVKRIDIPQINLPPSTQRQCLQRERTQSPPTIARAPPPLADSPPEKEGSRKRKNAIVGICYACGLTEGEDVNNLFQHMRTCHKPETKGNCPDCSRPLSNTDKAIKHMIEEHVQISSRQALLDYWKPVNLTKARKLNPEPQETPSDTIKILITDVVIPLDEQPMAPQHAKIVKNSAVYASMLEPGRLRKLYKCMGRNCSFTSDVPEKFVKHIDHHKAITMGRIKDWQECVYCMELFGSGKELLEHFHSEHNKFVFQCCQCFYRSASESNVHFHQKVGHPGMSLRILLCQKDQPKSDMPSYAAVIGNLIKPYICNNGCTGKSFYRTEAFKDHLKDDHPICEEFFCHVCPFSAKSSDDLIKHYESHSYQEFNCLLCTFGAENQIKLHNHLCVKHPNYSPCLAARSLLGLKTEKNLLVGALRGLESKLQPFYQPPIESDASASEEEDEITSSLRSNEVMPPSPTTPTVTPIFSRTLSAIAMSQSTPSTSTSPFSRVEKTIAQAEKSPAPVATTSTSTTDQSPKLVVAAAVEKVPEAATTTPSGPPPVTRPLSTFSRMDKEKPSTSLGPPPVTQPLSTFSRTASAVESEDTSKFNLTGRDLYICCNPGCDHACATEREFGDHLLICAFTNTVTELFCVHCKRTLKTIPGLQTHLREIHGPPRFTCGVCQTFKCPNLTKVQGHLKTFHGVLRTVTKAKNAFKTDLNIDEFSVNPKVDPPPRPSTSKSANLKKFNPGQEDLLPTTHIFPHDVYCALCDFKTRVRTNILRHLKDHGTRGIEANSSAIPINPTPCLKTGEKHFDKMLNWAKSSHVGPDGTLLLPERRRSQDLPDEDVLKMPIFVAEPSRYVCGIPDCWYKSSDVSMLLLHLENLHDGCTEFKCIHCTDQSWLNESPDLSLFDRSVYHMKQHGPNLFICLLCRFAEATRKDMEKHFQDEHKDESLQIQVIREMEPEDGATWCCSECKFTCFSVEDMKEHSASLHDITEQFRCSNCMFRAMTPDIVIVHNMKEHAGKAYRVFASFYPIGFHDSRVIVGHPTIPGELDKTRHIRQIRIEEVGQSEKKSPEKKRPLPALTSDWTLDDMIVEFGPMGSPDGHFLVCPKCKLFKNRQQSRFRDHMFRELEFKKYTCNLCAINVVSKSSLQNHLLKIHKIEGDYSDHILLNESRPELEKFVSEMIKHQLQLMPRENAVIVDPLALDDELVVPELPAPESFKQDPLDFEDSPMEVDEAGGSTNYPELHIYNASPSKRKKSLNKAGTNICKHCFESFKTTMALKMHIKLYHFKAGKFICDYCDVSATSENIIIKHSAKQHPDLEPRPKPNPNADKFVFDEAFWDRVYGIYKTKMRSEFVPEAEQLAVETNHDCEHCSFKTAHASAMKRHIVSHKFTYGCGVCENFESEHSAEVRDHCASDHPGQECIVKQILQDRPAKIRRVEEPVRVPVLIQPPSSPPPPPPTPVTPKPEEKEPTASAGPDASAPSTSGGTRPPATYGCKYCNFVADRLKLVHQHWEETHKLDKLKFQFAQVLGKKCRHCNAVVNGEEDMKDHFKQLHPEYVTISFQIYLCEMCPFQSDMLAETVKHLSEKHQHTGPSHGYTVKCESVRGNKQVWCLCMLCYGYSCIGEKTLTKHSQQVHPGSQPKYIVLNNKGQRLVRELGFVDQLSGNMRLHAVRPNVSALVKSEAAQGGGARRLYLCPETSCDVKFKTLKGMEEHVRMSHVTRMQCGDCNQIFVNDIAAKMHHLVEHKEPDSPSSLANLFKLEEDVEMLMQKVRREGDAAPSTSVEALTKEEPK